MLHHSVLIIEDEPDIRELLSYRLRKEGYHVTAVATGEEGLRTADQSPPDIVLLDLLLPGMDGLLVCRRLKAAPKTASVPVIMVTAKGEEADVVSGLNMGAEDYITKPFSPRVVSARVRAVLRRTAATTQDEPEAAQQPLSVGNLVIHPGRHEVLRDGEPIPLTATEFRLLYLLARRPGWVFTRQQILDGLHGDHYAVTDRAVDVQVVGLRKKLGAAGDLIQTVRGVGYRFRE